MSTPKISYTINKIKYLIIKQYMGHFLKNYFLDTIKNYWLKKISNLQTHRHHRYPHPHHHSVFGQLQVPQVTCHLGHLAF